MSAETAQPARKEFSVSEITSLIKERLESGFPEVWVRGEISNLRKPASGHIYLTLKDEKANLQAVMFKFQNMYMRFEPENGMEVLCRGRISVYQPRGEYQLIIDQMEPAGVGALQKAFEQLKARLEKEGLFDPEIKKPLPAYPSRVALITSPTGAAVRDFIRIIKTCKTPPDVLIIPSRVQGEGAAEELARAVARADSPEVANPANRKPLDLIVLARGGGSLEDLWAFNEEVLARAIARSRLPILSAVGHEIDFTIADFVADARASTPTAAARLVTASRETLAEDLLNAIRLMSRAIISRHQKDAELLHWLSRSISDPRTRIETEMLRIDEQLWKMEKWMRSRIAPIELELSGNEKALSLLHPRAAYAEAAARLDNNLAGVVKAMTRAMESETKRLESHAGKLGSLSPLATLSRGYSIAKNMETGEIIKDAANADTGDRLELVLHKGGLECEVTGRKDSGGTQ